MSLPTPSQPPTARPAWAGRWLVAAGIYNLLWGAWVIAFPHALFDWSGLERLNHPSIWQCVGMIVGVYGVGYLIASRAPRVHWPIVLVGLVGKILGPLGFAWGIVQGTLPASMGVTILTNDLVWWLPFAMILWDAARAQHPLPDTPAPTLSDVLASERDQHGVTLGELCGDRPLLVVLTRHAGCTFCKETLAKLSAHKSDISAQGWNIAVVTMSTPRANQQHAQAYGLADVSWFSDPDRRVYRALELGRGGFLQLFGPAVLFRGIAAGLRGHGVGRLEGDGFQMPGTFVLHRGRIVRAYRHQRASDVPDLRSMTCEIPA